MQPALYALWFLVGWCGTPWPRRWPPPPDPDPWWYRVLGAIGGVIGGWAYSAVFAGGDLAGGAIYAAATSVGAVVGSIIVQDVIAGVRGR
jgi:hypothetical protein